MNPERWRQVREILEGAISIPPDERRAYLDQASSNDAELRLEVESLLRSHERADSVFMKTPAIDWADSASEDDHKFDRVGRRIGVYQIVGEIGHGGMGEVYRALRADGQYEKEVAIKLVRVGLDTSILLARFRHERQILANLDHPNIARLLDGGTTEDGIPYLVMELVAGVPIDTYCEATGLDVTERLRIFLQVCAALQFAHQRLVIHRDIKPSNILVTEDGVPKLLDFGIAKIVGASGAAEETALRPMTLEYSSPEQVRGEPLNTATDVYSLGVVLYRMLTGRSPYAVAGDTPHELSQAIIETDPLRPSAVVAPSEALTSGDASPLTGMEKRELPQVSTGKLRRLLRGDIDNIVLKALRKEPHRRYASVEQFAQDIRYQLAGLPVGASKGSRSYRAKKFLRRNRVGVTAGALVVLTLIVGLIVTLREARIAAQNQRRAQQHFDDVRQLADSLMFEVHDSIQDLPGATPARHLIVERSLEYLNRLARESGGEIPLQRELANAYERIGLVQGDPDASNLGDVAGAHDSFRKALNFREQLANLHPNDTADQIALAASDRELCRINARYLGSIGTALDYCNKAVSIAERQNTGNPGNRAVLTELAKDYEATGRAYGENSTAGNAGDSYKALENHRKAFALVGELTSEYPTDLDLSIWHGSLSILTADDLFETGHVKEAVPLYQQAVRTFENITQQSNSLTYLNILPLAYQRMGDMLLVDGRFEESLQYYRKQLDTATKLVVADPKSVSFRGDLVAARATYGHGLWRAGHVQEGLASLRRGLEEIASGKQKDSRTRGLALTIGLWTAGGMEKGGDREGALHQYQVTVTTYSDICRSDPKDVEDCIMVAGVLDRVGRIHLQEGKLDEALAEYQSALGIIEPLSTGDEPNLEALYTLVNVEYGLGEVDRIRAGSVSMQSQKSENWTQARNWYEKSRTAYLRIPSWQPITPNELESRSLNAIEARLSLFQHAPARISASNRAR
jgi:non-specific serine/threonine protein kinase/serine/threonine-protein kinase